MSVGASRDPLAAVVLAVSSFRNDAAVLRLLEGAGAGLARFHQVLVVDSLGTGRMPEALRERGLEGVRYEVAAENLGSAGNLARRLELAAATEARFVLALNHDGVLDLERTEQLVRAAEEQGPGLGAAYPLRRMTGRGGVYDVTGQARVPLRSRRVPAPPPGRLLPVWWSTSNGALYSLGPPRAGLLPPAELWMGWEDLAYGWRLQAAGYRQVQVLDVCIDDGYEFRRVAGTSVSDKPSWYAYYSARNLILAARLTGQPRWVHAVLACRLVAELGVTLALRQDKLARLRAMLQGVADGARGVTGKWVLP